MPRLVKTLAGPPVCCPSAGLDSQYSGSYPMIGNLEGLAGQTEGGDPNSWHEPVPHAMNCEEVARSVGVQLQLLAQPDHMRIDGARVGKRLVAPDRVQDHVAR